MTTTIVAYQGLDNFSLTQDNDEVTHNWNPSNDMVRDDSRDNVCLLQFRARSTGTNSLHVRVEGQTVQENLPLGANGLTAVAFRSSRVNPGTTKIQFHLHGSGSVAVEECVVFYKRQPSGLPGN
jgi:hypothetical protein